MFPGRPSSDSFQSWVALKLLAQERLALVSAFLGAAVRGASITARYVPFTKLLVLQSRGGIAIAVFGKTLTFEVGIESEN